jgi:hypothetical protein
MSPQKVVQNLTLAKVHQFVTANNNSGDADCYICGLCLQMYTMTKRVEKGCDRGI